MGVSIKMGLPAVPNNGLATAGFNVGVEAIGSAMSIFGFVYFIQPFMMAMVQEMPVRKPYNPTLNPKRRTPSLHIRKALYSSCTSSSCLKPVS